MNKSIVPAIALLAMLGGGTIAQAKSVREKSRTKTSEQSTPQHKQARPNKSAEANPQVTPDAKPKAGG